MSEPDILTQLRTSELACERIMKPLGLTFKAASDEIERLRDDQIPPVDDLAGIIRMLIGSDDLAARSLAEAIITATKRR